MPHSIVIAIQIITILVMIGFTIAMVRINRKIRRNLEEATKNFNEVMKNYPKF